MAGIDSWSGTPATNATADGGSINWAENQVPSSVNNTARQMCADVRTAFNDLVWFQYGTGNQGSGNLAVPAVYASGTSFTIAGVDVTGTYHANRRVRAVGVSTGTIYGTISSASFSTNTTVNVTWDSGSLSNETLVIALSQIPVTGTPITYSSITGTSTVPVPLIITGAYSNVIVAGRLGNTTPAFRVDSSAATQITGIQITGKATGNGVAIAAIGEASNGNLTIDAQGSGTITLGGTSTGALTLTRATTFTNGTTALIATATSTTALAVGRQGSTSPAFQVDTTTGGTTVTGLLVTAKATGVGVALAAISSSSQEDLKIDAKGAGGTLYLQNDSGGAVYFAGSIAQAQCPVNVVSASATSLTVGRLGSTTPALQIDASTATSITGIKIKSAASAGGVAFSTIGETNVALTIDANGTGTIVLGGSSTGAITLTRATTLSNALTYGGVTLSNAVTGTGNMVLSAAPTLTGTLNTADIVATSAGANALAVGRLGSTTPALQIDASTGTSITGIKIKAAATGGGVAFSAIGETNVALTINANGSGTIGIGSVSTGAVTITPATTVTGVLTTSTGITDNGGQIRITAVDGANGPALYINDLHTSNGAERNWAITNSGGSNTGGSSLGYGDLGIYVSSAQSGNPMTAGVLAARFNNAGSLVMGNAAIATNATDGFLYIPTCAGTPTGTPTAYTGRIAMIYDTSNHQFWFYDSGWKQPKTPGAAALITWQ
jgi:hypothetical protein